MVCVMLKKRAKLIQDRYFSGLLKPYYKYGYWLFLKSGNILYVQELCKQQQIKTDTETDKIINQTEKS